MSIYCDCEVYDPEPGDVVWYAPKDYTTLPEGRRVRCRSCRNLIDVGAICTRFSRFKIPYHEVEVAIYGEDGEIPRKPWWLCEECSDLYFSLTELGYCFELSQPMRDHLAAYHEVSAQAERMAEGREATDES